MSESNEPSYYEVALTNRQVMVSFILLLSCLMAAFVSGVWLGRSGESSPAARLEPVNQEPEELAGLEEFKFFTDREAGEAGSGVAAAQRESGEPSGLPPQRRETQTLAQDLGVERTPPPPPRSEELQRSDPPVSSTSRQPPTPVASSSATPATGSGFTIQVFSTKDEVQAKKVLSDLQKDGYAAYLSPVEVGSQTMYRVRIGPFADRESAREVADRVNRQHKLDTWIPSSGT